MVVRGIGPSLAQFGVPNALAHPVLELHGPAGFTTIINDNWNENVPPGPPITNTGLAPSDARESAILATLDPGAYTAIGPGKNDTSGVGLVEIYDIDQMARSQLANISTRGFVGTEGNVLIGGFILSNGNDTHVLIRGIGPSLTAFRVPNALADPTLELHDSNGLLASNDDCGGGPIPVNPPEACIDITLPPGLYTTILAGENGGTGIGLVEIYNLN